MAASTALVHQLFKASTLVRPDTGDASWTLGEVRGRLVELSSIRGGPSLTIAFSLIADALRQAQPAAWVSGRRELFHPPDVMAWGLPLDQLPVVRVRGPQQAARAASHLLRSGAFGLCVLDLGSASVVPAPLVSRLVKMAQSHDAAVLCLTEKLAEQPSIGSLVSLRCVAETEHVGPASFRVRVTALKDKRRSPGWTHEETHRGPLGLR